MSFPVYISYTVKPSLCTSSLLYLYIQSWALLSEALPLGAFPPLWGADRKGGAAGRSGPWVGAEPSLAGDWAGE